MDVANLSRHHTDNCYEQAPEGPHSRCLGFVWGPYSWPQKSPTADVLVSFWAIEGPNTRVSQKDSGQTQNTFPCLEKQSWASTKHFPPSKTILGNHKNTFPVSKTILGIHKTLPPQKKRTWASKNHPPVPKTTQGIQTPFPWIDSLWL